MNPELTIAVLVFGHGSTLQALIDAIEDGRLPLCIGTVVSDRPGVFALTRAAVHAIPTRVVDRKAGSLSQRIGEAIPAETRLLILAGFLSIVTEPLLSRFPRRIVNLHPALLPKYGGAGMYGERVHRAVVEAGERESGCTVHFVDEGTDTGEIILQRRVPVYPDDTSASLRERIGPVERAALIDALLTILPDLRYDAAQQGDST